MDNDYLVKVMIQLQKKYNKLNGILILTKQMEEAISRSDDVSFKILINMRQDEMIELEPYNEAVKAILAKMTPEERSAAMGQISATEKPKPPETATEVRLGEIQGNIKSALRKIIAIDEKINKKIARGESFYEIKETF